jgi:hypothetical protein
MKHVLRVVLLAALAALGIWLWTVLFPGPEKIIRRRLVELARTASATPDESNLARLAAARQVVGYFANNVEMKVDSPRFGPRSSMDREEMMQLAVYARSRAGGLTVAFPDITVTVARGSQAAVANVTVEVKAGAEPDSFMQEMKFTLRKIDGQWLITRVETVPTLSRASPGRTIYPIDGEPAALYQASCHLPV